MKKTTLICDRCGKTCESQHLFRSAPIHVSADAFCFYGMKADLCEDCFNEMCGEMGKIAAKYEMPLSNEQA